jgi:hypothetical protein
MPVAIIACRLVAAPPVASAHVTAMASGRQRGHQLHAIRVTRVAPAVTVPTTSGTAAGRSIVHGRCAAHQVFGRAPVAIGISHRRGAGVEGTAAPAHVSGGVAMLQTGCLALDALRCSAVKA